MNVFVRTNNDYYLLIILCLFYLYFILIQLIYYFNVSIIRDIFLFGDTKDEIPYKFLYRLLLFSFNNFTRKFWLPKETRQTQFFPINIFSHNNINKLHSWRKPRFAANSFRESAQIPICQDARDTYARSGAVISNRRFSKVASAQPSSLEGQ